MSKRFKCDEICLDLEQNRNKGRDILTVIVAGCHHRVQMIFLAALCDDAEAQQVAVATGDVKRCVSPVVHQCGVTAGLQEMLTHLRLACYHGQVERSLENDGYYISRFLQFAIFTIIATRRSVNQMTWNMYM